MNKLSKAVIPLSNFSDDFLPATKAVPKEMMPVVDKPLVQYVVEEAAVAGITDIIFLTGFGKRIVEDHFAHAVAIDDESVACGDSRPLAELRTQLPLAMRYSAVRQRDGNGIGDAILRARPFLGDDAFAVLLPDQLIDAEPVALAQLSALFAPLGKSVIGVQTRPVSEANTSGALPRERALEFSKPLPDRPSSTGAEYAGRFIFTAAVFDCLIRLRTAGAAHIGLDDLIAALPTFAETMHCEIVGRRYDCHSKLGYMKAMADFGMKHPAVGVALSDFVTSLKAEKRLTLAAPQ